MSVTRRRFLQTGLALSASGAAPWAFASSVEDYMLFGAWQRQRSYGAGMLNASLQHSTDLVTRGHHIEIINDNEAWLFARRPSSYMLRVDWRTGRVLTRYIYDSTRTGFGHGIMSSDGLLLTTDQRLDDDAGLLTIRDGRTGEIKQEFLSGGIGPHELLMMPDGIHVAIANGGVLTRPDSGRAKLNLAQMQPSLTILNRYTGGITHQAQLDDARLSIRHLAHLPNHAIGIALQYEQGEGKAAEPVAAIWQPEAGIKLLEAQAEPFNRAQGYAASAASDGLSYFAVSCPKANAVMIWTVKGQWLRTLNVPLAYGLAVMSQVNCLAVSSENGGIYYFDTQTWQEKTTQNQTFDVQWDNHLVAYRRS